MFIRGYRPELSSSFIFLEMVKQTLVGALRDILSSVIRHILAYIRISHFTVHAGPMQLISYSSVEVIS